MGSGHLTVFPSGQSLPTASNLNYTTGQVVPNLVVVALGLSGQVSVYSSAATDVLIDIEGYVASSSSLGPGGGLYNALPAPARIVEPQIPGEPVGTQ